MSKLSRLSKYVLKIVSAILAFLALLFLSTSVVSASVVINEIMYDPVVPEGCTTESKSEWVELYNQGSSDFLLDGWKLGDENSDSNSKNDSLDGAIAPGNGYLVIAADKACFQLLYPDFAGEVFDLPSNNIGSGLNNTGDTVILLDETGDMVKPVDSVTYSTDWGAKNNGSSLERKSATGNSNDASNWQESSVGGTPGAANSGGIAPSPSPSPSLSPLPTSSSAKSTSVSPSSSPQPTGITTRLSDAGRKDFEEPVLGIQEATHSAGGEEAPGATEAGESSPKEDLVAGFTGRNILAFGLALAGLALLGFSSFSFLKGKPSDKMETHE